MRFLVDRCAGATLALWLRSKDRDVAEARERGPDPGDEQLLAQAFAERRELERGASTLEDRDFERSLQDLRVRPNGASPVREKVGFIG